VLIENLLGLVFMDVHGSCPLGSHLINSGRSGLASEMRRLKAQIAGNGHSIAKICNDETVHFRPKMQVHE
jgi:hypothetical protein